MRKTLSRISKSVFGAILIFIISLFTTLTSDGLSDTDGRSHYKKPNSKANHFLFCLSINFKPYIRQIVVMILVNVRKNFYALNFSLLVNLFSDQINWNAILINLSVDTADLLNIIINSLKHPSFELSTYRSNYSL
jgi:hypothetical protein